MRHALGTAVLSIVVAALGWTLSAEPAVALVAGGPEMALQGNCAASPNVNTDRGAGAAISTIACPGLSTAPLTFSYSDGTAESCLYIDNADPQSHTFFVPMQQSVEWNAFKTSSLSDSLSHSVSLVYGCPSETLASPCSGTKTLPAGRNGQSMQVTVTPTMTATYTCTALSACGHWSLSQTPGSCTTNGACGSANGTTVETAPASGLCNEGNPSAVSGSGPWTWTCDPGDGGTPASCSANMAAAVCTPGPLTYAGYHTECNAACEQVGTLVYYYTDGCGTYGNIQNCWGLPCSSGGGCVPTYQYYTGQYSGTCSDACDVVDGVWSDNCGHTETRSMYCDSHVCGMR